jgi:hypothetical protein
MAEEFAALDSQTLFAISFSWSANERLSTGC